MPLTRVATVYQSSRNTRRKTPIADKCHNYTESIPKRDVNLRALTAMVARDCMIHYTTGHTHLIN